MKTQDAEGKLDQHILQNWFQPEFAKARRGGHDLPLRHFIDGIDVVQAFVALVIALMYGVQTQEAGLALGIGPPAFSNHDWSRPGLGVVQAAFAVALLFPQVVQMGHRDSGQPLELQLAIHLILALQHAPGGGSA